MADTYLKDLLARYTYQAKHITDKTYSCDANNKEFEEEYFFSNVKHLKTWNKHVKKADKQVKGRALNVVERLAYLELDAAVKSHKYKLEEQL